MYTFDENLISDLHKDAYGFRPSESFWATFAAFNPEQKQALWDSMLSELDRSIREDEELEQAAIVKFEDRIDNLMHEGTNRMRVVAWLIDADDSLNDPEYFEFLNGLPYGYLKSKGYV
jgi:hypothetical protein